LSSGTKDPYGPPGPAPGCNSSGRLLRRSWRRHLGSTRTLPCATPPSPTLTTSPARPGQTVTAEQVASGGGRAAAWSKLSVQRNAAPWTRFCAGRDSPGQPPQLAAAPALAG